MFYNRNKPADVTIIPYENTIDGVLEVLRSQLRYVEPPYYGPGSHYMVEDPVSDTDDPNVKSNVVGDHRKKSLPRAIDTKWGRIVHEYELELARAGKQLQDGFLMPQNLEQRLLQITHDKQKDQAGVLVPEAEGRGAKEAAKCAVKLRALNIEGAPL